MNITLLKSISHVCVGQTAALRGLLPGKIFHLFVVVRAEAVLVGTFFFSDAGTSGELPLRHRLHV